MSTPTPTQERYTEHEVLMYLRVAGSINNIVDKNAGAMEMKINTPLTKALDAMSCIPFVQTSVFSYEMDKEALTIGNVDAGTLVNPKVDVILEKSSPSSFGRGSETVLDPSYRNGREIPAVDLGFKDLIKGSVLYHVKEVMFPGREVDLKLYKLAVYEAGGHFDWHMDSTHSDKHHATLLVGLNTSWDGGNLILRRQGIETTVDLHPQQSLNDNTFLEAVAFFTDTEHRVEPVKDGIRIVLQYDIEVTKTREDEEKNADGTEETKGEDDDDEEEEEEEEEEENSYEPWTGNVWDRYSKRMDVRGVAQATADKSAVENVLRIIKTSHENGTKEVAFALQHLYRKASISAEYLKGSDAVLYDALVASGDFDTSLHPVILREASGWDGEMEERGAYRYGNVEVDSSSESPPQRKRRRVEDCAFHIPELSAIQQISKQEYIEHTGNEAMPAEYRYFGGGMFVRPKAK